MTRTEKITQFFEQLRGKGNPTAQNIYNAMAAAGDITEIMPEILAYCAGMGIDAAAELANLTKAQDTVRQEATLKETAASLAEKSGALAAEADPEKRRELIEGIRRASASLEGAGKKDRIGSWDAYIRECTEYDPEKDFRPALFDGVAFPPGTVSYIGARAKAGKTTAMINLTREAFFSGRKTLFITLEMSRRQLLTKLVLCVAFVITGETPDKQEELRGRGSFNRREQTGQTPQKDYYALLHGKPLPQYGGEEVFRTAVSKAQDIVKQAYGKTFLIYAGRGAGFQEITAAREYYGGPGSLVLIDYIQRMPSADENSRDDYTRVKKISDGVLNAAVRTNTIIISGAQFNRTVTRDSQGNEIIETTSFRESGDLEQDAHNILGIGRLAGKGNRYIKMFAGREEMIEDNAYRLDFDGVYSYMTVKEKIKAPEEAKHYPPKKKKEEVPEPIPEEGKKWSEVFQDKGGGNHEKS
ncbi:MAG: hypothetical protein LBG26_00820 [Treponema sp.]|jgi:hypothetical protein|nr:hypothetical protein [Treponema sp.]